ncbi:MFS transporter [Azohydromonas australica]|uniref:MFS transporter n=1 Tax=Azohydromonas australica TaxID=364039 RepID=UPI00040BCD78|nr:MFS transporter [Azohydromonas australica]
MTRRLLRASFLIPTLCFAVLVTSNGIISTHISLQLGKSGYSVPDIGLVQAAYFVGLAMGSPLAVALIARIGERRLFALCTAIGAAASAGHLVQADLVLWSMLRLVMGICLAGVFTSMESSLHAAVSNDVRGRLFAYYQLATYASISGGQFLLSAASGSSIEPFGLTAALLFTASLPALARARDSDNSAEKLHHFSKASFSDYRKVLECCSLSMVASGLSGIFLSSFYTLLPAAAAGLGLHEQEVSSFIGIGVGAALFCLWPVARLSDGIGRPRTLLFISSVICASAAMLFSYPSPQALSTWGLAYSAAIFCVYAQATSDANDRLPSSMQGAAVAMILATYSLGGCLGPVLTSLWMDKSGHAGYFSVVFGSGLVLWLSSFFTLLRRKKESRLLMRT